MKENVKWAKLFAILMLIFSVLSGPLEAFAQDVSSASDVEELVSSSVNSSSNVDANENASSDIIKIGYETSEKIHLMIKYLLENNNSHTWLGTSQYLINWFSDDLANESQLDIVKPVFNESDMLETYHTWRIHLCPVQEETFQQSSSPTSFSKS